MFCQYGWILSFIARQVWLIGGRGRGRVYHEKGPDGVVEEDDGCGHKHGETDEFIELGRELAALFPCCVSTWERC